MASEHTYPSRHGPGSHWATDEAWSILDTIKPGVIPDDARALLAGLIAGTVMRYDRGQSRSPVPPDVRELVIAARIVAFEDQSPEALKRLDEASEAFAARVPWEGKRDA